MNFRISYKYSFNDILQNQAELWTHRISLYYVEQEEGAWLVPENIKQTVIETAPGLPFEVNFQDLNVDGNKHYHDCYDFRLIKQFFKWHYNIHNLIDFR